MLAKKQLTRMKPNEAINSIIVSYVTPLLRSAGFKKYGRTWTRSHGGFDVLVNIQASRWNGEETGASFVVNYGVYIPQLYKTCFDGDIVLPKHPSAYHLELLSTRVTSGWGGDIWWEIYDYTNMKKLGKRLVAKIEKQTLTLFDSLRSLQDIENAVKRGKLDTASEKITKALSDLATEP